MSSLSKNPYLRGTPEHRLWERYHRAFFDQPVHGQLLSIESQLRHNINELRRIAAKLPADATRPELRQCLLEMEESVDLLDEIAEHAFVRVISRGSMPVQDRGTR